MLNYVYFLLLIFFFLNMNYLIERHQGRIEKKNNEGSIITMEMNEK